MLNGRITAAAFASAILLAGATTNGIGGDALTFHDPSAIHVIQRATAWFRPIVTEGGSLMAGEMAETYRQPPHYHTQEQFTFATSGSFDLAIGGVTHHLTRYAVGLAPSDVPHAMTNTSGARAGLLEYHPIARPDWLEVTGQVPQSSGPAAAVPAGAAVTADLSPGSTGWTVQQNGARVKAFGGKTIRVRMLDLSAAQASVDVTAGGPEVKRFIYVFNGRAAVTSGSTKRDIDRGMCVEVAPAADRVTLASTNTSETMVAVFEPLAK